MRIVVVSPHLPKPSPDNAGERYLGFLNSALGGHEVTYLVPDLPHNREASAYEGAPMHVLVALHTRSLPFEPLRRALDMARRLRPLGATPGFIRGVRLDARAMEALGDADIVDVQWEDYATLLPALRRLAPGAKSVATFHDVVSQRFDRLSRVAGSARSAIKWRSSRGQARAIERRVCRTADAVIVFSDKDRMLLPFEATTTVLYPPIAADSPGVTGDSPARQAVFVGPLYREVNHQGMQWIARRVWPIVREQLPDADLVIVGTAPEDRARELSAIAGIRVLGFCEDLEPLYEEAALTVAPLLQGAGVKFKVIDSLARGVPVVGTSVATEGIGDAVYTPPAFNRPRDFANEIIRILSDPGAARREVAAAQEWARERYGQAQFERSIADIYGRGRSLDDGATPVTPADTSNVIPERRS